MKASVIIACHNCQDWVGAALASVAAQTLEPFETIVVDDDSTDDSTGVVQSCSPKARLLRVNVHNAAAARNAGIDAATGEWIAFLDADNTWYPNHLQEAARLLSDSKDVAYMAYPGRTPMPGGRVVSGPYRSPVRALTHDDFVALRARRAFGFPTTGQVISASQLRSRGGFDVSQVRRHDIELFMRTIHGQTWTFHPGPTWWSRPPRPGNISADEVKCKYYALRAMALNEQRYGTGTMAPILRDAARKAVTTAALGGTTQDLDRAWNLAAAYLSRRERWMLSAARHVPGAIGSVRRLRGISPPRRQPA